MQMEGRRAAWRPGRENLPANDTPRKVDRAYTRRTTDRPPCTIPHRYPAALATTAGQPAGSPSPVLIATAIPVADLPAGQIPPLRRCSDTSHDGTLASHELHEHQSAVRRH